MMTRPSPDPQSPEAFPESEVVAIDLLLPAAWANALVEMSERRQRSVAELIRDAISKTLVEDGDATS